MKQIKFVSFIDRGSALFYWALALAAFAPSLLGRQAYFGGDILIQNIPLTDFLKQSLLQGHWPLWCPCLFGGQPFSADPNCMVFYPPVYLYLLPSKALGSGLFYALHLLIAALGTHFWLARIGFPLSARRLAAASFALSGFFWWEIIHVQVLAGFAWLPWWLGALEGLAQTLQRAWAFAAGLFFGLIFLCGSFQILLGAVYGGGIYLLFCVLKAGGRGWRKKLKAGKLLSLTAAFLWGAVPSLALAVPFFEYSLLTGRVKEAHDYLLFNTDYSDQPAKLFRFLFPTPNAPSGGIGAPLSDLLENAGYLGIWFPLLASFSFGNPKRRGFAWFWLIFGIFALLLCLGPSTPLQEWLCDHLLGFSLIRSPYRFAYLFLLAGVFLSALGWSFLKEQKPKALGQWAPWFWIYAIAAAALALFYFQDQGPAVLGLALGGLGFWLMGKKGKTVRVGEWVFLGALAASLIWSGWKTCPSRLGPDSNFDFLKNRPELAQVKQIAGLGRVFIGDGIPYSARSGGEILPLTLTTDVVYSVGLRHVKGSSPISLWKTSQLFGLPVETLGRLMAVNVVATGKKKPLSPPGYVEEPLGPFYIFRALRPFPFVYAPKRFEVAPSDEERLALMGEKGFDPYQLSYFSTAPPADWPPKTFSQPDSMSFQLTRDDPDEEVFQVNRRQGGWTVFSEVVYPGWKVWVDGVSAPLWTANHVFRSVFVPAGSHEVRFSYEPVWWTPLRIALALWFLSVLGFFFKPWRKWALGKAP